MAGSKDYAVLDLQNESDSLGVDLQFQDFGETRTNQGSQHEQTITFSDFPDTPEEELEQEKVGPKIKRRKYAENLSPMPLCPGKVIVTPVLPEGVMGKAEFVQVAVLQVKDKKSTSMAVKELSMKLPIPALTHLKRVRKLSSVDRSSSKQSEEASCEKKLELDALYVYLTYLEDFGVSALSDTGSENLMPLDKTDSDKVMIVLKEKDIDLSLFTQKVFVSKVSKFAPKVRDMYDKVFPSWPCTLHIDLYLAKLSSGNFLSEEELKAVVKFMNMALDLGKKTITENGAPVGVVIVDSESGSVVGVGQDRRFKHPAQHAAMIAIDNVALHYGGGAWDVHTTDENGISIDKTVCGTSTFRSMEVSPTVNVVGSNESESNQGTLTDSNGSEAEGMSYICTGRDVYMSREPCMMCAMALLHSRVRRIFYHVPNPISGALQSKTKLHTLNGINHRYELLGEEDEEKPIGLKGGTGFWTFEFYQQFFDVESKQVGDRILWSMVPKPGVSYLQSYIRPNPDLYGPFWICMTLTFTTAITGNLANYLGSRPEESYIWRYDFHKVTLAATAIFCYAWLIPLAVWGVLVWRGSRAKISLLELLCIYGYSLAIFVPVSILWIVPQPWFKWCLAIVAPILSGSVLVRTVWPSLSHDAKQVAIGIAAFILILHATLALGFMMYFFTAPEPAPSSIEPIQPNIKPNQTIAPTKRQTDEAKKNETAKAVETALKKEPGGGVKAEEPAVPVQKKSDDSITKKSVKVSEAESVKPANVKVSEAKSDTPAKVSKEPPVVSKDAGPPKDTKKETDSKIKPDVNVSEKDKADGVDSDVNKKDTKS